MVAWPWMATVADGLGEAACLPVDGGDGRAPGHFCVSLGRGWGSRPQGGCAFVGAGLVHIVVVAMLVDVCLLVHKEEALFIL